MTQESVLWAKLLGWFLYIFMHWKEKMKVKSLSHVWPFVTPWTVAYQASLSMGFSRQGYWSRLPFLLQGIFPTQGSNPGLPHCWQKLYHLSHQGSHSCIKAIQKGQSFNYLHIWLFCNPMDCSPQAPLSMGFPRQEYWGGLPFSSPGDLLMQGLNLHLFIGRQILYHWATREALDKKGWS